MWLGQTAAEQQEALSRLQITQIEGGQHHGMYVASDAVAKLINKTHKYTGDKIKIIMDAPANAAHFSSRINMPSGNANVRFTQLFCTSNTNSTGSDFLGPSTNFFLGTNFLYLVLTFADRLISYGGQGTGEIVLLNLTDMVLLLDCLPAARKPAAAAVVGVATGSAFSRVQANAARTGAVPVVFCLKLSSGCKIHT